MRRMLLACGVALLAASASAQTTTGAPPPLPDTFAQKFILHDGHDLVAICSVPSSDSKYAESIGFCRGFGRGAMAYYREVTPAKGKHPLFCPPAKPPSEQAVLSEFLLWADANPAKLDEPAVNAVFRFLAETYPCATTPTTKKK